jgi:hypothetical protein
LSYSIEEIKIYVLVDDDFGVDSANGKYNNNNAKNAKTGNLQGAKDGHLKSHHISSCNLENLVK